MKTEQWYECIKCSNPGTGKYCAQCSTEFKQARKVNPHGTIEAQIQSAVSSYPAPPPPSIIASKIGTSLPIASGVYFVWYYERVVYVGRSITLRHRVNLSHDRIQKQHKISFLEFPLEKLNAAESYYIGVLDPVFNANSKNRHPITGELMSEIDNRNLLYLTDADSAYV